MSTVYRFTRVGNALRRKNIHTSLNRGRKTGDIVIVPHRKKWGDRIGAELLKFVGK